MTTPSFQPLPCDDGGGQPPEVSGCCSPSITAGRSCLPDGTPVLLVVRSGCADCSAEPGEPEVAGWIDPANGQFTAGPPPGAGPCEPDECGSVSVLRLCDLGDDSGGACTPFLRFLALTCDGEVASFTDRELDGVTVYTPTGEVIDCDDCPCTDGTRTLALCDYQPDGTSTAFLRWLTYDCQTGDVIEQHDTLPDGATPHFPAGEVGECGQCRPAPMCPQLLGLAGPETWEMPDGTESVSVTVACGPVTITDCAGNTTQVNECGTSFSWGAPASGGCGPAALCSPFTVDIPDGAAAYITYVSPCATGDES